MQDLPIDASLHLFIVLIGLGQPRRQPSFSLGSNRPLVCGVQEDIHAELGRERPAQRRLGDSPAQMIAADTPTQHTVAYLAGNASDFFGADPDIEKSGPAMRQRAFDRHPGQVLVKPSAVDATDIRHQRSVRQNICNSQKLVLAQKRCGLGLSPVYNQPYSSSCEARMIVCPAGEVVAIGSDLSAILVYGNFADAAADVAAWRLEKELRLIFSVSDANATSPRKSSARAPASARPI